MTLNVDPAARTELYITLGVLIAEIALLVFCRLKIKQPVNPARPRLLPYGTLMIFLTLGFMVTAAHTVSLVTGKQLMPKTKQNRNGMGGMGMGGLGY